MCKNESTEPESCVLKNHKAAVQKQMSYICNNTGISAGKGMMTGFMLELSSK